MIAKINIPVDVTIEMDTNGLYTIKAEIHNLYCIEDDLEKAIEQFKILFHEYVAELEISREDYIEEKIELSKSKLE